MKRTKHIGILGTEKGPHVAALTEAFRQRGAVVSLLAPTHLTANLPGRQGFAKREGEAEDQPFSWGELDALLVRSLPGGSLEQVIYRVDALHRVENLGIKLINSIQVIEKTVDKAYTTALLADAGLPVPRTFVTESFQEAMAVVRAFGDVVIKPLFGSLGKGMVRVQDPEVGYRVLRALEAGHYIYYLQEYLPHENEDIRVFVLGGEVIAAMRRKGSGWKTNIACGARAEALKLEPALEDLALRAAHLLKADYVGVDILMSHGQPYLIEANGIPGWSGLQRVTPFNIAERLADYTLAQCED